MRHIGLNWLAVDLLARQLLPLGRMSREALTGVLSAWQVSSGKAGSNANSATHELAELMERHLLTCKRLSDSLLAIYIREGLGIHPITAHPKYGDLPHPTRSLPCSHLCSLPLTHTEEVPRIPLWANQRMGAATSVGGTGAKPGAIKNL